MGKIVCAIEKCSKTNEKQAGGQRMSFFSFPSEEKVLNRWLDFVNEHNVKKLDKETLDRKRLRLCHLHFQRKCVRENKRDRVLVPNSVPELAVGAKKYKTRSTKNKPTASSGKALPAQPTTPLTPPPTAADPNTATTTTPSAGPVTDDAGKPDSTPLYHSINGYVVDLRFASQLEMFRLPNGKLIQVRKQAKKAPTAATTTAAAPPNPEVAPAVEEEKVAEKPKDKVAEVVPYVLENLEAKGKAERAAKKTGTRKRLAIPAPEPEKPAVPVHYKTYTNRRSQGVPVTTPVPRVPQASVTVPVTVDPVPTSELPAPAAAPVRPKNPMPQPQPQKPRRPVVAPCLTALQNLVFKTHDEITPFDLFQKQFENQLISTAEIALHVVAKINNLISSNPFKMAETEDDLKYMYHHVGYILKYAIDRFTGLTETCAADIKDMGFVHRADLGPVFGAAVKDPEPAVLETSATTTTTTPAAPATPAAEPERKEADDEDCAIVEQPLDMIEIDSEDDDDQDQTEQPAMEKPTSAAANVQVEPTPNSLPLRICSATESPPQEDHHASSRSTSSSESETSAEGEDQFIISEIDEPRGVIRQDSETTLKIANVIEQYYREETESEEEEEQEKEETSKAGKQTEPMEVDEPDKTEPESKETTGNTTDEEEEETTELIEIIDGDDEQEMDNDPEYSVVECGDGDFYLVTTDGDEVQ